MADAPAPQARDAPRSSSPPAAASNASPQVAAPRSSPPPPAELWPRTPEALAPELVDDYLAFVGVPRPIAPTLDALRGLMSAHLLAIPFENLDAYVDRPVPIDRPSLAAKLLSGRRGGYCYEHNLLFSSVLVALGYAVELLSCRFMLGQTEARPPTHLALRVTIDGEPVLSDVGFGLQSLREPILMVPGLVQRQGTHDFCLLEAGDQFVLHTRALRDDADWDQLYVVDPVAIYEADARLANHFVETHPESSMKQRIMVLKPSPEGKRSISGGRLTIDEPGRQESRSFSVDELEAVLDTEFGLTLPWPVDALER